jgi:hypothetical protein
MLLLHYCEEAGEKHHTHRKISRKAGILQKEDDEFSLLSMVPSLMDLRELENNNKQ